MTNDQILQRVYIHLGSQEKTGLVEPVVLAMADLAYIDLARFLIDTDKELAKKLITQNTSTLTYTSISGGSLDTFNISNSAGVLQEGDTVKITGTSLSDSTVYYAKSVTPTSTKISATLGGNAVTNIDDGIIAGGTIDIVGKLWSDNKYNAPSNMLFHVQKPVLRLELGTELCYQVEDRDKLNMIGSTLANNYYALEGKTFYIRHKTNGTTSGSDLNLRYYKIPKASDIDDELAPIFLDILFRRLVTAMQSSAPQPLSIPQKGAK